MARLKTIFCGGYNISISKPAASDPPNAVLIINQDGRDAFNQGVGLSGFAGGSTGLMRIDDVASKNIQPSLLNHSSMRLALKGTAAWKPDNFIVWGEVEQRAVSLYPPEIIPLAFENDITKTISNSGTATGDVVTSIPLRLLKKGSNAMQINRLYFIVLTLWSTDDTGTDSPITLQITTADGNTVVNYLFPDTPQKDFDKATFCSYLVPVNSPFSRQDLNESSIRISIGGDDWWSPSAVYIFGMDDATGHPEQMVPLVSIHNWKEVLDELSSDPSEGSQSVTLPLYSIPPDLPTSSSE